MSGPIDSVLCFHNAFRRDALEIDDAAFKAARSGGDIARVLSRIQTMGEILNYHVRGEEEAVFPVVDKVAPLLTEGYFLDHRQLDTMVAGLERMRAAPEAMTVARATAVLNAHLWIHLNKEELQLYPVLRERTTEDEQASIVALLTRKTPLERIPVLVRWLLPLLGHDDRAVVTRSWMTLMPAQVFVGVKPSIREAVGEDWSELTRRVPELDYTSMT